MGVCPIEPNLQLTKRKIVEKQKDLNLLANYPLKIKCLCCVVWIFAISTIPRINLKEFVLT